VTAGAACPEDRAQAGDTLMIPVAVETLTQSISRQMVTSFLSGYRLWGVYSGSTSFQVTIRFYRGSNLIAEKIGSYATSSSVKTSEVHFSQVISIRAGVTYTATARIVTSASSFAHADGVASATCSGVTVTFKSKSSKDSNSSSQGGGQIPVLIFRSSQC